MNYMDKAGIKGYAPERVIIRCDDGVEACVVTRTEFEIQGNRSVNYMVSIEDSYIYRREYEGFFGRLKKAFHVLIGRPVVYADIVITDKERIKAFLEAALELVYKDDGGKK